jgi:surface polysaccharide O-acyltransferase-like enzyme
LSGFSHQQPSPESPAHAAAASTALSTGAGDRPYYSSIDVLKALGIVTVIWIHAFLIYGWALHGVDAAAAFLTHFAVPAFFFAGGFLACVSGPRSLGDLARRRLVRLLAPYAIASLLAMLVRRAVYGQNISLTEGVFELLTGSALGVYYFIPMFVGAVLVGWLLAWRGALAPPLAVLFVILGLLSEMRLLGWHQYFGQSALFWEVRNPMRWWGYFLAGWVIAEHRGTIARLAPAARLAIGLGLLAATAITLAVFLLLPVTPWSRLVGALQYCGVYGLTGGIFLLSFDRPPRRVVRYLSEATYPLYLYHFFFIDAVLYHAWPTFDRRILAFVAATTGAMAVLILGRRLFGARARWLIG